MKDVLKFQATVLSRKAIELAAKVDAAEDLQPEISSLFVMVSDLQKLWNTLQVTQEMGDA